MAIAIQAEPLHFHSTARASQRAHEPRAVVVAPHTSALVFIATRIDDADNVFGSHRPSDAIPIKASSVPAHRRNHAVFRGPAPARRNRPIPSALATDDAHHPSLSTLSAPASLLTFPHPLLTAAEMSQTMSSSAPTHCNDSRPAAPAATPVLRTQMKQDLQRQQCMEEEHRVELDALLCMRTASHDYDTMRKVYNPTGASYRRLCGLEKGARAMSQ